MRGQVHMFTWLAVLCGIVHAYISEGNLNEKNISTTILNEAEYNVTSNYTKDFSNAKTSKETNIEKPIGVTHDRTTEFSTTKRSNKTNVDNAVIEYYPYAVLFGGTCGGTIISSKWIITAASCIINSSGSYILAGTDNTAVNSGITRRVKRKVIHPLFLVGPYWLKAREHRSRQVRSRFNYLLVELEEPLPLDGITIKAAKLNRTYEFVPKTKVSFAGYGADYHGGLMQSNMHIRKFELQTHEECARVKGYSRVDMICAKGAPPNPDYACQGDIGRGLVDENGVLIGITSWIEDKAKEYRTGTIVFFAKIAAVRRWIHEVTNI